MGPAISVRTGARADAQTHEVGDEDAADEGVRGGGGDEPGDHDGAEDARGGHGRARDEDHGDEEDGGRGDCVRARGTKRTMSILGDATQRGRDDDDGEGGGGRTHGMRSRRGPGSRRPSKCCA